MKYSIQNNRPLIQIILICVCIIESHKHDKLWINLIEFKIIKYPFTSIIYLYFRNIVSMPFILYKYLDFLLSGKTKNWENKQMIYIANILIYV